MRDDLLDAQACVDWALSQFPSLQERVNAWLKLNVKVVIEDPDPSVSNNIIVAIQRQELPRFFNVEVGAYINAMRSSLDMLATALAIHYGIGKPDDAYFPVARNAAEFFAGNYKGSKLVKGLPLPKRQIIEALKPYHGGNEMLWSLHQLDIMRKHRRLLTVIAEPDFFSIEGPGARHFTPVATGFMRADNISERKVVLGMIAKGTSQYEMKFTPYIAFDEAALMNRKRLIRTLDDLASLATAIISLYDGP